MSSQLHFRGRIAAVSRDARSAVVTLDAGSYKPFAMINRDTRVTGRGGVSHWEEGLVVEGEGRAAPEAIIAHTVKVESPQ